LSALQIPDDEIREFLVIAKAEFKKPNPYANALRLAIQIDRCLGFRDAA
jgi:hypothetical protein